MKRALWFGLCFACACSSGSKFVPAAPGSKDIDAGAADGGNVGSSGKGGKGGSSSDAGTATGGKGGSGGSAGDAGDASTNDELAPSISFTLPMPADNPDSANVIVDPSVRVRCKAVQSSATGAAAVDKTSVKITLQDTNDATKTIAGTVAAVGDDEYEVTFDASGQKNGSLKFGCSAKDLTTHSASASMTTLLDLGPTIDLQAPLDKGIYALHAPFNIKFKVTSAPVADPDSKAAVKSVQLTVGGIDTPVTESKDTPGLYQTSIDFSDPNKYPVTPTGAQIQVFAQDGRSPTPGSRRAEANVTIDGDGPQITVTSPTQFSIQHGRVPLVVSVTDPSGVMPNTLVATVNNKQYMSWSGTAPTYTQVFDTRDIDKDNVLTQLTINLTAVDNVGNKTSPEVSYTLRLDNLPPVISLDPPTAVETRTSNHVVVCSQPFDPLGTAAPNDLDHVLASVYFRTLVEDRTNHSPGSNVDYLSGTNPSKVALFLQPLSEVALLIDTNGDHVCDEIYNNNDDDQTHPPLADDHLPITVGLSAVTPTGSSWFAKPTTPNTVNNAPMCPSDPNGNDDPPAHACHNSDMYRVVAGRIQGKPPAVYTLGPSNSDGSGECTGMAWEILGKTRGRVGWMCAAARVEDNIGNVGVSAPLRVCFNDGTSTPNCDPAMAPTCTDGCSISDAQKYIGTQYFSLD